MEFSRQIGAIKKNNQVTIFQNKRWDKIIQRSLKKGVGFQLSSEFIMKLLKVIHNESIKQQTGVMNAPERKGNF